VCLVNRTEEADSAAGQLNPSAQIPGCDLIDRLAASTTENGKDIARVENFLSVRITQPHYRLAQISDHNLVITLTGFVS
jgi:hypothetical protein